MQNINVFQCTKEMFKNLRTKTYKKYLYRNLDEEKNHSHLKSPQTTKQK